MYSLLLAIIYAAFISLGLPDSLLGSAWPVMHEILGVPVSGAGLVTMIISAGTIVSSLFSDRLTRKFGAGLVTAVSVLMTAAALFGFSISNEFFLLCLWAVPYGLGAGAVDAALNNFVALHYSSRDMSWLHCFWGVGTIVSPYVMSWALMHSVWQTGYRMVGGIQFAIALVLILTLPVWKIHQKGEAQEENGKILGISGALKIRGVPSLLLGFFAYCAAESTTMLWASSFLVEARGITKEVAAAFGALFYIGITAGRFLSGLVSEKLGDRTMIRLGAAVMGVGIACVLLPWGGNLPALAGLVIIGLGCAPVYPSIIHATPGNFGAENSQAIIGIQMASAYVGSTFVPPVFGLIANHVSIRLFPVYILLFGILMIAMTETTFRKVQRR